MHPTPNYQEVLRRHALPEVLFHPDIAFVLGLTLEAADEGARTGRFGQQFYVDGRVAILRQDFIDALARLGEATDPRAKEVLGTRLRALGGQEP